MHNKKEDILFIFEVYILVPLETELNLYKFSVLQGNNTYTSSIKFSWSYL